MKQKLISFVAGIILLVLLCSGIFADIVKFFSWLLMLSYSEADTSLAGGIVVRVLTFAVSYSLVGIIFNALGWFNSNAMKIVYFIVSTLISFALSFVVMVLEKYALIIGIALGVILLGVIAIIVIAKIKQKKEENLC